MTQFILLDHVVGLINLNHLFFTLQSNIAIQQTLKTYPPSSHFPLDLPLFLKLLCIIYNSFFVSQCFCHGAEIGDHKNNHGYKLKVRFI